MLSAVTSRLSVEFHLNENTLQARHCLTANPLRYHDGFTPSDIDLKKEYRMLLNAFSLNMVQNFPVTVTVTEITAAEARTHLLALAEEAGEAELIQSAVGHADTAAVFSAVLGLPVPCNRATVALQPGDRVIVGQYSGPRLPEGATTLPEGAQIKWLAVSIT